MKIKHLNTAFLFIFAFVLVVFGTSCSKNPVTGKRDFMLLSKKGEVSLGQQSDPGIIASYGLYEDEKIQSFIKSKGLQMARVSHRPELDYQFRILDSPVVNAFAVPGGYVYFTRGIMAHFNNEAEFAGVLGHEIGHITARHSAKQYSKQMVAQVGMVLGMVFSPAFRQFGEMAQSGVGLLFLKFGRDAESESDALGVDYSTKIGYDAHQMAGFFNTIHRLQEDAGVEIPTFLSTHPDPVDRNANVDAISDAWQERQPNKKFKINRDQYLQMIDGMVYGEDPKQGYVENDYFFHPVLKFKFPIPRNWNTVNTPAQVQMAPENGKAAIIFTLAQEKTLEAAAQGTIQENKIQVIDQRNDRVNGLSAITILGDVEALRVRSYLIEYNGLIYKIHGLAEQADFANYERYFIETMTNFNQLTDPAKINVSPERIRIKRVSNDSELSAVLKGFKVPADRMTEHAILNGMELNDKLTKGMLIKVVGK